MTPSPPATLAEGPLGKNGLHTWGGFIIGNLPLPLDPARAYIDSITGLRDRPEAEDNRASNTGRDGEIIYPSRLRGKNIVYTGRLQAADPVVLAETVTAFLAATASTEQGFLTCSPFPDRGGIEWFAPGRIITAVVDPDFSRGANARPTPWQHDFVLTIRMHTSYFAGGDPHTDSDASAFTATNAGTAPGDPEITVAVASGTHDIAIGNSANGKSLVFNDVPGPGDLVVNFLGRTVQIGSDPAIQYLDDTASNWWDEGVNGLEVGAQDLSQTGGTSISATWYDTVY